MRKAGVIKLFKTGGLLALLPLFLVACGGAAQPTPTPTSTSDLQAIINAVVEMTIAALPTPIPHRPQICKL